MKISFDVRLSNVVSSILIDITHLVVQMRIIWLQINNLKYKPYLINFVYRPPNSPQSWIDSFELQINKADMEDCNLYSTGDFNFPCLSQNIFNNKKMGKTYH